MKYIMLDESKLVALVSQHKELYDKDDKNYSNHLKRDVGWQDIAEDMGASDKECRDLWKRLREQYRKAIQFRSDGGAKRRPWKLEFEMSFLLPFMKEIPYVPVYSFENKKSSGENIKNDYESEDDTDNLMCLLPSSPGSSSPLHVKKKKEKESVLPFRTETNYPPLINFFISLGETTLTLPHHLQMEVKRKVFEAVHEAELETVKRRRTCTSCTKSESD